MTELGSASNSRTGTTLRFWPDEKYFDSPLISIPYLKKVLRAKAALCPKLLGSLDDQSSNEQVMW